jgi:hypothetical protein
MNTKDLLNAHGIKTAIIVDDGVDPLPYISDLVGVRDDWTLFWEDLSEADENILLEVYPEFENADANDLIETHAFVLTLFKAREQFESEALKTVFVDFLAKKAQVKAFIDQVSALLTGWGVTVEREGRNFVEKGAKADFIILDLFLGSAQAGHDKDRSIDGLGEILKKRGDNPPPVILTSAHTDLSNLRHQFRDETGLHASGFRALSKSELLEDGHLEQLVYELVAHRVNSLKLGAYISSWNAGMQQALDRTTTEMRKLDLEDIAHVQALKLSGEGASVGSYLVDVMDRVVVHELEAENGVIDAALALGDMTSKEFPPNTIVGSKDTLSVVHKTLFVHKNRLRLAETDGFPVSFGDVIAVKPGAANSSRTIFEGDNDRVFIVLTPICDLVRKKPKAKRAMLLAGTCTELNAQAYKENASGPHTPVMELEGRGRVIVKWVPKHVETVSSKKLKSMLSDKGPAYLACRMREHAATALQQTLLSDLGRVGEIMAMPSMFPVTCNVYYTGRDRTLKTLGIVLNGVRVIGSKNSSILAFDSSQRTEFQAVVASVLDDVYKSSEEKVKAALAPDALNQIFTRGFVCKMEPKAMPCKLKIDGKDREIGKVIPVAEMDSQDQGSRLSMGLIFELNE